VCKRYVEKERERGGDRRKIEETYRKIKTELQIKNK